MTATRIGVDPVITICANTSGGVCGKMISPQSIAVATAATDLVGREGDIFRFTLKHSMILTACIGAMAYLQAYVIRWIVPVYAKAAPGTAPVAAKLDLSTGGMYLAVALAVVVAITFMARSVGREK